MTILHHKDIIRHANWATNATAEVFTTAGYMAAEAGMRSVKLWTRRQARADSVVADYPPTSTYVSAGISNMSPETRAAHNARLNIEFEAAVTLYEGQVVNIEDENYTVSFTAGSDGEYPEHSDPVHFARV